MIKVENKINKLKLEYNYGVNEKGKDIFKSKTYQNISEGVTVDNLNILANMLSDFCSKDLVSKKILTEAEIVEEV